MTKVLLHVFLTVVLFSNSCHLFAQSSLFYRSEFEKMGDQIADVDLPGEGSFDYEIVGGNNDNHFVIEPTTGIISINTVIEDVIGEVTRHDLLIQCNNEQTSIVVVDGYDYTLSNSNEYVILESHKETYIVPGNPYLGYNNLWGRGTAQEGVDFRMATLCHADLPDQTIFVWDTPSSPGDFDGASVWCYISVLWGNRKGIREDLSGFPIQLSSIESMELDFDFKQLYGTEGYKIALNHFVTDEAYLDDFSSNDGDFFFVFDQKGTWIPPYPTVLTDTIINEKPFARLYKEENGYEWRRVIIKDNEQLLQGSIDMKGIYDSFISRGYLNKNQYVPNIQVGLEVTDGFGALKFNSLNIKLNEEPLSINATKGSEVLVYPNPSKGIFRVSKAGPWTVYNMNGQVMKAGEESVFDISAFSSGVYLFEQNGHVIKLIKR
ncbi:T9SS type A sorting domain-containing protein [Carboxylicivirga sp. N1Y90]|uniref:T9SS type A sorting domain-containing protein n=1 Tax=Carboxylicivirga fragile TaxID=3417571 RepID=UPI003D35454C|nr:T9SS type A sorting domain-containing protein [Marinilabiliaceae bacterium N1Y90]